LCSGAEVRTGVGVLAGHKDWNGKEGAFAKIGDLSAGDEIVVDRLDGSRAVFSVVPLIVRPRAARRARTYGLTSRSGTG
jgi:hypothetical protein